MVESNLEDIIVYEGVITKFGVIKHLIDWEDESLDIDIRKATREEVARYHKRPDK